MLTCNTLILFNKLINKCSVLIPNTLYINKHNPHKQLWVLSSSYGYESVRRSGSLRNAVLEQSEMRTEKPFAGNKLFKSTDG